MERLSFNINAPPDPARLMGMLSMMSEDERNDLLQAASRNMQNLPSDPLSQQTIREQWEKAKANFGPNGNAYKEMQGKHQLTYTQSWAVKQDSQTSFSSAGMTFSSVLETHSPMLISNLKVGQTHQGRLLIGTIADGFWSINSGVFLLEDLSGHVVEVAVYNTPKETFSKLFRRGRGVCIVEPFFKVRGDGSAGIRVDKPGEILSWSQPQISESWKELGDASIKHCPKMALLCYEQALQAPNMAILETIGYASIGSSQVEGKKNSKKQRKKSKANQNEGRIEETIIQEALEAKLEVSKLLTNLSLCEFKIGNAQGSLFWALLAFGLGLDRFKASYRIAKALEMCGLEKGAQDFAAWYCSSYEADSPAKKGSMLLRDFNITAKNCAEGRSTGSSWVRGGTLESLVQASSLIHQALESSAKETTGAASKPMPWLSAKQCGNELFQQNDIASAKDHYISALSSCLFAEKLLKETSFILSNKGAAWLGIAGDSSSEGKVPGVPLVEGAVSMLSAILMHFYENGRAWVRLSRFLAHQGRQADSTDFLNAASSILEKKDFQIPFIQYTKEPSSRALRFVQNELSDIQRRTESRNKVEEISIMSTEDQLQQRMTINPNSFTGRSSEQMLDKDIFEYEQAYSMHQMMDMMMPETTPKFGEMKKLLGPTKDRDLVDYCAEFIRSKGIPEGLDYLFAQKVLHRSFVNDRLHPWMQAMGWRMAWSGDKDKDLQDSLTSKGDMIKRWHGTAALSLISQKPAEYTRHGAIIDIRHMKPSFSYDLRLRSNFVNCPNRSDTLYEGKTHLAVGFNDLSFLNCHWQSNHESTVTHVVGIEMNPFSVAKSIVIAEMLSNPNIALENVLQSWYSTVWSCQTLAQFKDSVKLVLEKGERQLAPHRYGTDDSPMGQWQTVGQYSAENVSNSKVASYLHHWLSADPVSFKEARSLWLKNTVKQNIKMFHSISSCKRSKDRLAVTQYCLTGEVFGQANFQPNTLNSVGSLPFWKCPEGSPPLEEDSVFNTFLLADMMATFSEDKNRNLVQVFEARALSMLKTIRTRLLNKELTIELYLGVVKPLKDPSGHDLVRFVAERVKPRTIGWSNVIDYVELHELHDIGRAMSPDGNTTHYGYSMNWCTEVFGANILDYQIVKNYQGALTLLDLSLGENFTGNNEMYVNMLEVFGIIVGANEVFHFPDWDTPMNSTSFVAAQITRKHWIEYFYAKLKQSNGQVGCPLKTSASFCYTAHNCSSSENPNAELTPVAPCPLHRQSTQTYLEWTYDSKLKLASVYASKTPDSVLDQYQKETMALLRMM